MTKKRLTLLIVPTLFSILFCLSFSNSSFAVSASDWNAGNIIDDSIFTDSQSMSVSQIQAFLNSKVPLCDTNGTNGTTLTSRRDYIRSLGYDIPLTCLKDYYEVPKTEPGPGVPANNYGGKPVPDGAKSAAQLIKDAADKYNISPKVLLVKLGTESPGPLTSDDWPILSQYTYAMGAHCPDSGPNGSANCDVNYSGFSLQISEAAKLLRGYLDNMTQPWWTYKKPYQVNSIHWNVTPSGCGASDVYIENRATAALYTYTPYQPNQAALNNMYGTGDSCSAYGNRNFWRVFINWFGNTTGPATYTYSVISNEIYSDSAYQTKLPDASSIEPNQVFYVKLVIKNTGNQVWYKNSLNLGGELPQNRGSEFATDSWKNPGRPATIDENTVIPDGQATFKFNMKAPPSLGVYQENFGVLIEGYTWLKGIISIPITVSSTNPYYAIKPLSFNVYSDKLMTNQISSSNIIKYTDSKIYVKAIIENIGNRTLPAGLTRLSASNPIDRASIFGDSSWLDGNSRATAALEGDILPQKTGTFVFSMTTPSTPQDLKQEQFGLLIENLAWLNYNVGTVSIKTNYRPASFLSTTAMLGIGESILSGDEKYQLILQGDGNLVLYAQRKALWASWTVDKGGVRLVMQADGNLVLYDKNWKAVWNSGTPGKGESSLYIQNDGNLVIYNVKNFTWASWTVQN